MGRLSRILLSVTCRRVALGERRGYSFPDGWIRIDWRDADYDINLVDSPRLPFRDKSRELIYSAHLIEHLPQETLGKLLRECHRCLRPRGRIRLECPDTEKLVRLYRASDRHMLDHFRKFRKEVLIDRFGYPETYLDDHLSVLGEVANYIVRDQGVHVPVFATREQFEAKFNSLDLELFAQWCFSLLTPEQRASGGHQNILYPSKLTLALEGAGFRDVQLMDFGRTAIPGLRLNNGPDSIMEKPHRRFYSLYIEAMRPVTQR